MSDFLYFLCTLLQSISKICSLSVSISLFGQAPSFLGEFSHDIIVVAPSLSFLNVLKSCYLVLFSLRKTQKTKKNTILLKIFYLISQQPEHFRTKFQLILEATVQGYNFRFFTIFGNWSCDHCPNMPLDGHRYYNLPYVVSFFFTFWFNHMRFPFQDICK